MEKYGEIRQTTDDNTIRRVHFVCWITKARKQAHTQNIQGESLDRGPELLSIKNYVIEIMT